MSGELHIAPPFHLDSTLHLDQGHRWRPDREDNGWYSSVLGYNLVRVRQKDKNYPLEFEPHTEEVESHLIWQFRVDEDIESVYQGMQSDPRMTALVDRYCGLRIMRVDPWECLVFFVLSAHNHYQSRVPTAPTSSSMDVIAEGFWRGDASWTHDRYPFPSPQELGSRRGLARLQELWSEQTGAPRRIRGLAEMPLRIHEAARFVEAGQLHRLQGESTDHAVFVLRTMLRGVGSKTANCVALFGLGRMDAFPVDTHVTEALLSLYGRDPFQPYAGYAAQLLALEGLEVAARRRIGYRTLGDAYRARRGCDSDCGGTKPRQ